MIKKLILVITTLFLLSACMTPGWITNLPNSSEEGYYFIRGMGNGHNKTEAYINAYADAKKKLNSKKGNTQIVFEYPPHTEKSENKTNQYYICSLVIKYKIISDNVVAEKVPKETGVLKIETETSGFIYIDSKYYGSISKTQGFTLKDIETGSHLIRIKYDNHLEDHVVSIKHGETSLVISTWKPAPPAPPFGDIRISAKTSAKIYIDGRYYRNIEKNSFVLLKEFNAGVHQIKIQYSGNSEQKRINLKAGGTEYLYFSWQPAYTPPSYMISISKGSFIMGKSSDIPERQQHKVSLDKYYLGSTEVTNQFAVEVFNWAIDKNYAEIREGSLFAKTGAKYLLVNLQGYSEGYSSPVTIKKGHLTINSGYEKHPITYITWYGAASFCNYLSLKEGLDTCYNPETWELTPETTGYRLPTEAEWEYAAVMGSSFSASGNYADDISPDDGFQTTAPVGSYSISSLGLFDMNGNVAEWCHDWWMIYPSEAQLNPTGPKRGTRRVGRGGSWISSRSFLTPTARDSASPSKAGAGLGFRLALRIY